MPVGGILDGYASSNADKTDLSDVPFSEGSRDEAHVGNPIVMGEVSDGGYRCAGRNTL